MYTIFDFGDYDSSGAMGNPFVKLLSVIDADEASQDFASARATVARKNIKYPTANTAANNSTGNSADAAGAVSSESAQMLNTLAKYFPALAAIIALNTLIVLALLLLAMYWICTQRRKEAKKRGNARPRSNIGRQTPRALTPMPMDDFNYAPPAPVHTYEPVSMALSEADTVLALPSPGFKYDPDSAKGMNRPHSYAPSTSGSPAPIRIAHLADGQGTVPEDQPFQPPSPGFTRTYSGNPGERPRSYA
jgi:saccharopepsin